MFHKPDSQPPSYPYLDPSHLSSSLLLSHYPHSSNYLPCQFYQGHQHTHLGPVHIALLGPCVGYRGEEGHGLPEGCWNDTHCLDSHRDMHHFRGERMMGKTVREGGEEGEVDQREKDEGEEW